VQLTASAAITAGQGVIATTAGKVVAVVAASGNVAQFVALEGAGADGQIFWAYRLPATKAS
jgi:hypothetical protein